MPDHTDATGAATEHGWELPAARPPAIPRMLTLSALAEGYRAGAFDPVAVAGEINRRMERIAADDRSVWISRVGRDALLARAAVLASDPTAPMRLPLYGIPFAVGDNVDVGGMETTLACPAYARMAGRDAEAVARAIAAGAMLVGKTNLDQFSTGLTGTRSPYGAPSSVFSDAHISGGAGSGAAVAVASGLASFAIGTDSGGAARVPAALNNLAGFRPSRGLIGMGGVACPCPITEVVAVIALEPFDIAEVFDAVAAPDRRDVRARAAPAFAPPGTGRTRIGVPPLDQWVTGGEAEADAMLAFHSAIRRMTALGGVVVNVRYEPVARASRLFVRPSFVAERTQAVGAFLDTDGDGIDPSVRTILRRGGLATACELVRDLHELEEIRREVDEVFEAVDVIMVPTVSRHPTFAEVEADPIGRSLSLAHFTGFVSLLDLAAITVPAGFSGDGLPVGIQLVGPAGSERALLRLADAFHARTGGIVGAGPERVPDRPRAARPVEPPRIPIAVAAAHMRGMPLNAELLAFGATLRRSGRTAPCYALHAIPGTAPARAGLVRLQGGGSEIAIEVWELSPDAFGRLVSAVTRPLAIGKVRLDSGEEVAGFLLEPAAVEATIDVSRFGDWRAYQASLSPPADP